MLGTSWWFTYVYLAHALALFSSLHRLRLKLEKSKFWWEDLLYLLAEAFNILLLGVMLYIHIHYYQQQMFPKMGYIISLIAYFMSVWLVRAGISISYSRGFRDCIMTSRLLRKHVAITIFSVLTGIVFSISGTAICIHKRSEVQELHHKHLPLVFIIPAIISDVLVDSYAVFTTYKFFMTTSFCPKCKMYVIAGLCGPLSTMLVTAICWTLSFTFFSSNALVQMSLLNLTVCYSVAMGSMPIIMCIVYFQEYPNAEMTPVSSLNMQVITFRHPPQTMDTDTIDNPENDGSITSQI